MLRSGHPWLFADSIREQSREGQLGELAVIYDRQNRFLAIGFFDPDSPLRVRVLHAGKPQTLDCAWWRARFQQASARRRGLFDERTTGHRWINGESDGWPGLVLDRYHTTLVLKLYAAAWLPRLEEVADLISDELPNERIILRLSRNIQAVAKQRWSLVDGKILRGAALTGPVIFQESGLRFEADVLRGQKTGFFLDQRENRRFIGNLSSGRAVLNAFSFTGGFSLYAARGGARSLMDLDISAHALAGAKRNFALNRSIDAVARCPREMIQGDAFEWLKDSPARRFDLVILDPPSFAKREMERANAIRAYGRLAEMGIDRLRQGGILAAASCSAHVSAGEFFEAVRRSAARSQREFQELQTTGHAADHPAGFKEAEYLKCIYLKLDRR